MNTALVLIDLQNDFFNCPNLLPAAEDLIARCSRLLSCARRRKLAVIHVWTTVDRDDDQRLPHWKETNRWICEQNTDGHQAPEGLSPIDGEIVIHKTGFNAFRNSQLDAFLREHNVRSVILAGLHLHACVRAFASECLERNLHVAIAEDAVGSNDPIHATATHRWLAARCVRFDGGERLIASNGSPPAAKLIHHSPCSSTDVLFEIPAAPVATVEAAVISASEECSRWRTVPVSVRCEMLAKLANLTETASETLARQMAIEIGKPIRHGREEVRRAAANIRDVIRRVIQSPFEIREEAGTVRRVPLGVVAIISPWNNPVAIPLGKIAPAVVWGNAVVWKPAPAATRISREVMRLLADAGLPGRLVQLLTGDHTTARTLAGNSSVDAVTLTGSLAAGRAVQEICARRFVPLQAELSGNNAAIVWNDADLANAARQIAGGAFGFAGQRCTANRRAIIPRRHCDAFLKELRSAAESLTWGDPLNNDTEIGPLIHRTKRDEHETRIARAEADQRVRQVIRLFGPRAREPRMSAGAHAQPTIICCDDPDHPLVQEESMSPLLVIQRADDFDHAIALCNGVRHGLVASLFSHSVSLQERFLAEAHAGILKLNTATAGADVRLPFGGWKASGIGPPEHGDADVHFYARWQAVYRADEFN